MVGPNKGRIIQPWVEDDNEKEKDTLDTQEQSNFGAWLDKPAQERQYLVKPLIASGYPGTFFGEGAIGKSTFLNDVIRSLVFAHPFAGYEVPRACKVGLISFEQDELELRRKYHLIYEKYYKDTLTWSTYRDTLGERLIVKDMNDLFLIQTDLESQGIHYYNWIVQHDLDLLILDTFSCVTMAEENSNEQIREVLKIVKKLCVLTGCSVILVHHVSKASRAGHSPISLRGASSLRENLQFSLSLSYHPNDPRGEGNIVRLYLDKTNLGPRQPEMWFERGPEGLFSPVSADVAKTEASTAALKAEEKEESSKLNVVMKHVKKAWDAGICPTPTSVQQASEGVGRDTFSQIMNVLEDSGKIIVEGPKNARRILNPNVASDI